jgi:L-asparaginase
LPTSPDPAAAPPPITVISIGGTIAMTPVEAGDGVAPSLSAADLLRETPGLDRVARLSAISLRRLPGAHIELGDVIELGDMIERELEGGAAGVVVTQGTDTLEEVAYALDLMLRVERPVVVTGAMRNPSALSPDGPANLAAAVRVAADPQAVGAGVLVVLDDEIHSARLVQKGHSSGLGAFSSFPGPIGWLSEGRVSIPLRSGPRIQPAIRPRGGEAPVALLTGSLGDDGRLLDGLQAAGYAGAVIEALGGGHLPEQMADRAAALVERMPVVFSTRVGRGEVLRETYDFPGSEVDLIRRGLIPAGPLDGPKARILLTMSLLAGLDRDEIHARFAESALDESVRERGLAE